MHIHLLQGQDLGLAPKLFIYLIVWAVVACITGAIVYVLEKEQAGENDMRKYTGARGIAWFLLFIIVMVAFALLGTKHARADTGGSALEGLAQQFQKIQNQRNKNVKSFADQAVIEHARQNGGALGHYVDRLDTLLRAESSLTTLIRDVNTYCNAQAAALTQIAADYNNTPSGKPIKMQYKLTLEQYVDHEGFDNLKQFQHVEHNKCVATFRHDLTKYDLWNDVKEGHE